MSCVDGVECRETSKRHTALLVLGVMLIIFLVLSAWSFLPSRGQVTPLKVEFADADAVYGKRVFQAYNCMGCHTIVGNGAYFGPDLTRIYADTGPAWLAAFLPSAGGWPTTTAVQVQLQKDVVRADAETADMDAYRKRFPGAAERMDLRGGQHTLMPNLPLKADEINALIAFFKYTSAMNTEGWPPRPHPERKIPARFSVSAPAVAGAPAAHEAGTPAATAPDSAAVQGDELISLGKQLVADLGCVACHAADERRTVGPGWGGLYGSEVELEDGSRVVADEAYIEEAIRDPNAKIVAGYPAHVMPSYDALINESDMQAIVAYLRSL